MSELVDKLRKMAMGLTTSPISHAMFEAADAIDSKANNIDSALIERVAKAIAGAEFSEMRDWSWDDMPYESTVIVSRKDFLEYAERVCYPSQALNQPAPNSGTDIVERRR